MKQYEIVLKFLIKLTYMPDSFLSCFSVHLYVVFIFKYVKVHMHMLPPFIPTEGQQRNQISEDMRTEEESEKCQKSSRR